MRYVELHARSAFSFLERASVPEALAYACIQQELPAMALLDRNGVYGSARFHLAAKANKLKAHVGAEVSVAEKPSFNVPYYPLLVANQTGYQNLCRLITKTKFRTKKNQPTASTMSELEEHSSGLICLTGDEDGPLAHALRKGGKEEARRWLHQLVRMFGATNIYVELQRHGKREQEQRNHIAIDLARELNLPLLATNGVLYATADERQVLDAVTCIKHKCLLDEAGSRLQRNSERHIRNGAEMAQIFSDLPEAISNTHDLSSRLEFTLENLGYKFPKYPTPNKETEIEFLRAQVLPIHVAQSEWNCTLQKEDKIALRLGLRYVRGLCQATAEAVVAKREERSFDSISDLTIRVPQLSKTDLHMLATIGALNSIGSSPEKINRRDALWQVQKYGSRVSSMLEGIVEQDGRSPLKQMNIEERLVADYRGTGLTIGPHPMAYRRAQLSEMGIVSAKELSSLPHGRSVDVAGCVITRQRPGTAKGLIFLTLEDETGHANAIVMPDIYSANPMVVLHEKFVRVRGKVQNQDGIVHVKAEKIMPLAISAAGPHSHDFH